MANRRRLADGRWQSRVGPRAPEVRGYRRPAVFFSLFGALMKDGPARGDGRGLPFSPCLAQGPCTCSKRRSTFGGMESQETNECTRPQEGGGGGGGQGADRAIGGSASPSHAVLGPTPVCLGWQRGQGDAWRGGTCTPAPLKGAWGVVNAPPLSGPCSQGQRLTRGAVRQRSGGLRAA